MKKFTLFLAAALFCGSMTTFAQDEEDITITPAQDAAGKPVFKFDSQEKYYIIQLDDQTRDANLTEDQYIYIGPDEKVGRPLYVWENTIKFADTTGKKNSFGVDGEYKACVVGSAAGWSGMGLNVKPNNPIDLSGINDDYVFHLVLSSTTKQSVDFYLVDGNKHEAHLVFGTKKYGTNAPVADFPRDGKWYNIDIPMTYIEDNFGLSFKKDNAYQDNNLFCVSIGSSIGNAVNYDAVFFYVPNNASTGIQDVKKADDANAPVKYYSLDGKQVTKQAAQANKGVYIMKQGNKTRKVIL